MDILIYQNNSKKLIYQGFLKDSKYHGKGILYDNSGNKKYEGNFNESKYYGIGIEYFKKGISKRKMVYDGFPLKECFGELYDEKSNLIYQGLLKNLKPEKGKNYAIYDEKRNCHPFRKKIPFRKSTISKKFKMFKKIEKYIKKIIKINEKNFRNGNFRNGKKSTI